jgi:hypothetical protein
MGLSHFVVLTNFGLSQGACHVIIYNKKKIIGDKKRFTILQKNKITRGISEKKTLQRDN